MSDRQEGTLGTDGHSISIDLFRVWISTVGERARIHKRTHGHANRAEWWYIVSRTITGRYRDTAGIIGLDVSMVVHDVKAQQCNIIMQLRREQDDSDRERSFQITRDTPPGRRGGRGGSGRDDVWGGRVRPLNRAF